MAGLSASPRKLFQQTLGNRPQPSFPLRPSPPLPGCGPPSQALPWCFLGVLCADIRRILASHVPDVRRAIVMAQLDRVAQVTSPLVPSARQYRTLLSTSVAATLLL